MELCCCSHCQVSSHLAASASVAIARCSCVGRDTSFLLSTKKETKLIYTVLAFQQPSNMTKNVKKFGNKATIKTSANLHKIKDIKVRAQKIGTAYNNFIQKLIERTRNKAGNYFP